MCGAAGKLESVTCCGQTDRQALDGMVFLEANGFVHGHITAENLLLEDSGQLRIGEI